jgi:putative ABC transport system ATP-binding protein
MYNKNMNKIVVSHITKMYGKKENAFTALRDISFEISTGSSVSVIGKSGSGKSTLMHIMSGLDRPTSGTVTIDGQELSSMNQKEMDEFRSKTMSFVFQAFFVEPNQTCYQNVLLPIEINEAPMQTRKKRVMEALSAVELEDKADTLAINLSGGQKQRLAIARAIINKPSILFADEPTGNLDSTTGEKIMNLLFDLNKKLGCTLILVTHDKELARLCKMQIDLKDGTVEYIRTK